MAAPTKPTPTAQPLTGRTRPTATWSRDRFENRLFAVLRVLVIAGLLLVTLFPFYYSVLLSLRPLDAVLQDPGALLPTDVDLGSYAGVLTSTASGGQGFGVFMRNSAVVALATVALTLAVALPGAYAVSRLRFFGHRQISVLFLAVYLFPAILLAVPLFVFFTRIGLHAAQLLRHGAGEPGGGGRDRRLQPAGHPLADQPAAGQAGDHRERTVHLHDRVE
jgi:multiple sugar transport system permease protein